MRKTVRTLVALAAAVALTATGPAARAASLTDVPATDRRAVEIADLASSSGVARPVDLYALPVGDEALADAYRALRRRGLRDFRGERVLGAAEARRGGGLHLETLVPELELRTYWASDGADGRVLYHSAGDRLSPGLNAFLSGAGTASWGEHLGAGYRVQAGRAGGDLDGKVKRLYLKGVWGKWSLKVGRDSERLGVGYHGTLLLDDNAPPLDLWRVRTEEPLFLPGRWSRLGGLRFTLFNGWLDDDTPEPTDRRFGTGEDPIPNPRLLGMRLSYHPTSWLDLGATRTILYSGDGRHQYTSPKDWWKLLTAVDENVTDGDHTYDNDQYMTLDVTVRLPILNGVGPLKGGKLYWEHGGTDLNAPWQGDGWGLMIVDLVRTSDLVGGYLTTGVTDLRVEYARTHKGWYRHGQYPQGYTYRGVPLGHHLGPGGEDWFAEVARHFGPGWRASVAVDLEERARDLDTQEDRTELQVAVEALDLAVLGVPLRARVEALTARVENALDTDDREDRTETYVGLTLTGEI